MIQNSQDNEASHKGEVGRGLYNPDVLNCIANLSNDEVFTPPELANKVLDLLPQELFSNPNTTFLDPFTKSGVFLREIVKRLDRGLEAQIPDRQERIDHILHKQVFGIAITELTSLLARRSVYCSKKANSEFSISKFDTESGNIIYKNIKHTWENGKCKFCGASQSVYDRGSEAEQYAYMFIHTNNPNIFFPNMKFDVIVGNPPYQMSDGGSGTGISAKPIYQLFVEQSVKLLPKYLCLIIPSRWFAGGKGLDEFRDSMLNNQHIRYLVDYPKSLDCFPGVDIAGGVCYFMIDKQYKGDCLLTTRINDKESSKMRKLNEFEIFVRDSIGIDIIHKIKHFTCSFMNSVVYSRNPFGFFSSERGGVKSSTNNLKLFSSGGIGYVNIESVTKNRELINKFKVFIGKVNPDRGGVNNARDGKMNVITKISVISPKELFTETYLLLGVFDSLEEANNCASYFKTKLARFLISLTLTSMNITKESFQFVPLQDFSHPWTDEMLYKKYGLTQEEIAFIESMIRPME